MIYSKRGVSPVIATTLLVSITLVLAVIVFFWARSFVSETIEKYERNVARSCEDVEFFAEAVREGNQGKLYVQNIGDVPIYAVEMSVKGRGEVKKIGQTGSQGTIQAGETQSFSLPDEANVGDIIRVVPILLGETKKDKRSYVCDSKYGVEAEYDE